MSAINFTPISLYYSATASATPSSGNLVAGELAINTNDGKLFYKDSSGVVQTLATKDATSGSFTNLAYTGTLTGGTGVVNLGSGQFYKDASGNVGIGTSSPVTLKSAITAQVFGNIKIGNANGAGLLSLGDTASSGANAGIWRGAAGAYGSTGNYLNLGGYDGITFTTGNADIASQTERMRIDSSGNVGIGTSSPSISGGSRKALTLNAPTGQLSILEFGVNGSLVGYVYANASQMTLDTGGARPITFITDSTERMRIDSSGKVLIGGTTSVYGGGSGRGALEVNGSADSLLAYTIAGSTTNSTYCYNTSTSFETNVVGSRYCYWTVNGSERMRIDSGGSVCINTTDATLGGSVGASRLATATTTGQTGITTDGYGDAIGFAIAVRQSASASGGLGWAFYCINSSGTYVGGIRTTTAVTTYLTASDYRLKNVIGSISDAGVRIDALEPIEYEWNTGGRTRGFLAHKFAEVYPNSVSGEKDAVDAEGKPIYQGMQASTSEVMADLIAEIQSLRKRVAQLESK